MKKEESTSVKLELTYFENATKFLPALDEVGKLSIKHIDTLLSIIRAKKESKKFLEELVELRKKIVEVDCIKNEDGEPLIENGMLFYENDEVGLDVRKKVDELERRVISFDVKPIKLQNLGEIEGVTPNMLEALKEFIILE